MKNCELSVTELYFTEKTEQKNTHLLILMIFKWVLFILIS